MYARATKKLLSSASFASAVLIIAAVAGFVPAAQAKTKYVTFTVIDGSPTEPTSINSKRAVTGSYGFSGEEQGFVRHSDGTIETFQVPGALQTDPTSINTKGEITGRYYVAPRGPWHGFLRKPDGTLKTFKIPHDNNGDFPVTVNASGTIFGYYGRGRTYLGFVRKKNGTITTVDCGRTMITAGNDLGVSTGGCASGAFVRDPEGTFTFFNAGEGTDPLSISDEGAVTGTIGLDQGSDQGFLRAADATITVFSAGQDVPTVPVSINANDTIAGRFLEVGVMFHGFVRTPDGTLTPFDPEGSKGTYPAAINDNGAITGNYTDQNSVVVGFIRLP